MNFFDALIDTCGQDSTNHHIYGVVVGLVANNQDPDKLGRVKVKFPWLSDKDESYWARIATPMAGKDRGFYCLPEVDDEVLVVFEHGDVRFPYIIGALWNGKDKPPENNSDGKNNIRLLKSRSGHTIKLNDKKGRETIEIIDKSGKNSLIFNTRRNTITIKAAGNIILSARTGAIKLDARKIDISSSTTVNIKANAMMNIKGTTINLN